MKSWFKRAATTPGASRHRSQPAATMPMILALEPRIMFDGAVVATVADTAADHHATTTDHQGPAANNDDASVHASGIAAASTGATNQRHEIVFIDGNVANYRQLVAAIKPGTEVVALDGGKDGLQQIADHLDGRDGIDAIHILSHGDVGKIQLGNDWIDSADLAARTDLLAGVGQSLTHDGDILVYGCRVAGEGGLDFVQSLAAATQADIAASSDLTGAANLGGDWLLEVNHGVVETNHLPGLTGYQGLLTAPADQNFDGQAVAGLGSNSVTIAGVTYFNNHAFNIAIVNDGFIAAGADHALGYRSSGPNLSTEVGFKTADGSEFKLNGFVVDRGFGADNNFTVKAYRNSMEVASTTVDVSEGTATLNVGGNSSWEYIDEVRITGADLDVDIDDLNFSDPVIPNTAPAIANLNGDSVAWAGIGNAVVLDASANASLTDAELEALNSGNGNWSGASLTVQRSTAVAADSFGFVASGLFTVSGTGASGNLQSGGLTFATYTNTGGVLTVNFTSSGTTATTALVNDVGRHVNDQNNTPAGDASIRFTLHDGTVAGTAANVTVTSDTIYVTNTTDTATINAVGGVSFSEAIAIAAADATGTQTIVIDASLAGQTVQTTAATSLGENLTLDLDPATGVMLSGGTLSIGSGFSLTASNGSSDAAGIAITLSGAGALTKAGAGTVTLSATNTYSGATTVSAGTLTVNGGDAIATASSVAVASGATLSLSANESVGNLSGAGSITLGSNTLSTTLTANSAFSGGISGGGGLSINQPAAAAFALTLSGANTYAGATTLQNYGWLRMNGDASLSSSTELRLNGNSKATMLSDQTVGSISSNSATANLDVGSFTLSAGGDNTSTSAAGVISGTGNLVKQGSGTLTLSGANTYSGTTGVGAGALSVSSDGNLGSAAITLASGSTLDMTGATNIDNAIVLSGNASVSTSANATLSGIISGSNNLSKTGAAALTLSGANTYGGTTTVSAGTLSLASDSNLGSGGLTLAAGATVALTGAANIDNAVTLSGAATVNTTADATLSGNVGGAGSLTKTGANTLTLSGSNSYAGTTTVSAGTLSVASDSNLGSSALTLASGSTLAVTGATTIDNALALSGGTATVSTSANATLSGNISGAGGLAKTGASTLRLSGTDSYIGATSVNAGTLLVNGALSATSNTTVASAATLGGSGSIASNVTVNSGGTLSPGNSAGIMTVDGDLTMASGSTLAVEINGATAGTGYAQVVVNGTVAVSGATLSVTHGYAPESGDSCTIIVNNAADAVTGNFSGISEGSTLIAGGNSTELTASYIGGTGNDFTLTAPLDPVVTSVTVLEADGSYKIGDSITVAVNFSEQIFLSTGTLQLTLETGTTDRTLSYTSGSGSSTLYFNYTVHEGDNSLDLDYVSSSGLAANGDTIQGATFIDAVLTLPTPGAAGSIAASKGVVIDGVRPTASIVVADAALAAGETSAVTITFNEPVSGLAVGDFTVANGALSSLSSGDGGVTWTATLTPTASITDTSNLITLGTTEVADAAGNTGTGTTDSNNYAIDTARPMAAIVVSDPALSAGETSLVTITFSEAVTGFTNAALAIANGALSAVNSADGGITWTATLTPPTSVTDATNLITLDNTGVSDVAGNAGIGTTDSNNYAIDTVRPTATIVVADSSLLAGDSSLVTITFTEAVAGFSNADLAVANGTLTAVSSSDGGVTWTATFTPDAGIAEATNLITLTNAGVLDAAGNAGAGSTDSNNYAIDTRIPVVTSVSVPGNGTYVAGQNLDFTVTLSEAVIVDGTGGVPRIAVTLDTGGTVYASYLSGSGSTELLFRLTVADGQLDANGVSLGGAIQTNGASVRNAEGDDASVQLNNVGSTTRVLVDASAPTASDLILIDASPANADTLHYLLSFSEDVSGVDVNDFLLVTTGSVRADVASVTQVDARTYDIALNNVAGNGTLRVNLNGSGTGIVDTAGNAVTGGLISAPHALTAVAPGILAARPENLPPAPPFSSRITAPLAASLPSIFDLQADFAPGYSSSSLAAPSIHTVAVGAHQRFNIPLPWRPEKFTQWSVVELRSSTGTEVPAWLHYDFTTGTLQGTPPVGFHGTLQIDLVETDSHGQRVIVTVQLHFDDVAQRSDADNSHNPPAKRTATKAGLDAQFASHARSTPLDADAASLLRRLHFRTPDRPPTRNQAHF